eukprot:363330-Chlamydomonas_euryale.AAC.17
MYSAISRARQGFTLHGWFEPGTPSSGLFALPEADRRDTASTLSTKEAQWQGSPPASWMPTGKHVPPHMLVEKFNKPKGTCKWQATLKPLLVDEVANDEDTNDEDTNDEVANDEVANDEVANDEVANDEVANDEVANDEVANDEVANDELTRF